LKGVTAFPVPIVEEGIEKTHAGLFLVQTIFETSIRFLLTDIILPPII